MNPDWVKNADKTTTDPGFKKDWEDTKALMDYIQKQVIYDAKVKIKGPNTDEYTVDVYENGLQNPPTRPDVKAYSMYTPDSFLVGADIQIRMMPDNTGIIVRMALPPGFGLHKVFQIMTDGYPGTPGWDVLRFPRVPG